MPLLGEPRYWMHGASRAAFWSPCSSGGRVAPRGRKDVVPFSAGDTVLVSVETETPTGASPSPIFGRVLKDGTLAIWCGQRVQIAGLTPDEAASRIKLAVITNYIGVVFHKVSAIKGQPTD